MTEEQTPAEETPTEEPKISKSDMLQIIANAIKLGNMSGKQAANIRATELGVFGSDFTKKKTSPEKRKAKRKAQKTARKVTRQHGYKGQKSPSGRRKSTY